MPWIALVSGVAILQQTTIELLILANYDIIMSFYLIFNKRNFIKMQSIYVMKLNK